MFVNYESLDPIMWLNIIDLTENSDKHKNN